MEIKVAKFGGTSLADAIQIAKVKKIIEADPARRYIVPSAPGKSAFYNVKVTDLLYALEHAIEQKEEYHSFYRQICERFTDIKRELGLQVDICLLYTSVNSLSLRPVRIHFTAALMW